jgi:hypothetical protein
MIIPTEIIVLFMSAWLAVQGWTLLTITRLLITVARLKQQLQDCRDECKVVKIAKKLEGL